MLLENFLSSYKDIAFLGNIDSDLDFQSANGRKEST